MGKAKKMHFSFNIMLCDIQMQLASIPFNSKGQGHLVTFAKGRFVGIFKSTFSGLVALLTIILALLPYVYKQ